MGGGAAGEGLAARLVAFVDIWAAAIVSSDAERIGRFMSEAWVIASKSVSRPARRPSPSSTRAP